MNHLLLPDLMSRNYKFHNPDAVCFISFAGVEWLEDYLYSSATDYAGEKGMLDEFGRMGHHAIQSRGSGGSKRPGRFPKPFRSFPELIR